jgi:hydrogenase maturation protein HypF
MAENGLRNQRVIGVAFDGTGLGSDNAIWGAEFLICDYKDFERKAYLKKIPLLGQERAILEPWRLAAAWLYSIYKDRFLNLGINFVRGINKNKWRILKNMYLSGFNCPLASSMGRLFDAVGSMVLEKHNADFEAGLAMALEQLAIRYPLSAIRYDFQIMKIQDEYTIDPTHMFKQIVSDLKGGEPKEKIAYRFHLTVSQMIRKMSIILRKKAGINKIVLSGGVFQNKLLLSLSSDLLRKDGFHVFIHRELSCDDSSISLGQAMVANFK